MTQNQAINYLIEYPADFGCSIGFTDLRDVHNEWIINMVCGSKDATLQGHRGSYKTTCLAISLSLIIVLLPLCKTLFMRKTDDDVKEVIKLVLKILRSQQMQYFTKCIYGKPVQITKATATEITTNLAIDIKGTSQLVGMGKGGSLTGKHFDKIFTDDIVNIKDRVSKAERDSTKLVYQELRNIINRGGRIFNTGTPWHKDDAFTLMPNPKKYDCYSTGLISAEELADIKSHMTASLFAANYELKHIASDDVIFQSPQTNADTALVEQGFSHVDASYGGTDYTALTIASRRNGKFYVFGKLWQKSVDDVKDEIVKLHNLFNTGRMWNETNADKGFLAKELRKEGVRVQTYHEDMNKFLKITSYLKAVWKDIVFVNGTDEEYINQICDYNENAEHDDAPDSLASLMRVYSKKSNNDDYKPLWL